MDEPIIKIREEVGTGLHPSLPQDRVPFWADGSNVHFNDGVVQPFPGQVVLLNKLANKPVHGMAEVLVDTEKFLFWGDIVGLYLYGDADDTVENVTHATPYTGTETETKTQIMSSWSFARWGRWIHATNGVNFPQVFKFPTDPSLPTGINFIDALQNGASGGATKFINKAEIVRALGPFLVYFNIEYYNGGTADPAGSSYCWSDIDDSQQLHASSSNAAGDLQIREMPSSIKAVVPFTRGLGVYGSNGLWLVRNVGAPEWLGHFLLIPDGVGAVSKHSVVAVGTLHYGMSQQGIFVTDGTRAQFIDQPSVHAYIYDSDRLNRNAMSTVVAYVDKSISTIFWFFPTGSNTSPDTAIAYNYVNNSWALPGFIRTAGSPGDVFARPLTADFYGNVYMQSIEGIPAASPGSPLTLAAEAVCSTRFGEGVFGTGPFGGSVTVEG